LNVQRKAGKFKWKHDDGSAVDPTGVLGPRSRDGVNSRRLKADPR
jgi:hypothetical protein